MQNERLTCDFLGFRLHSPLVLASGIIGTSATLMARAAHAGAGMVTAKSCGPEPRAGHPNPVALDWGGGLINAIGLTNPGAAHEALLLAETKRVLQPLGVPLIASIFAGTVEEFGQVAAIVAQRAARPDRGQHLLSQRGRRVRDALRRPAGERCCGHGVGPASAIRAGTVGRPARANIDQRQAGAQRAGHRTHRGRGG